MFEDDRHLQDLIKHIKVNMHPVGGTFWSQNLLKKTAISRMGQLLMFFKLDFMINLHNERGAYPSFILQSHQGL